MGIRLLGVRVLEDDAFETILKKWHIEVENLERKVLPQRREGREGRGRGMMVAEWSGLNHQS